MLERFIQGRSPLVAQMLKNLTIYARSPWPVLILGETGVGKELLAKEVHTQSLRNKDGFFAINCGSLPAGLFESELFGHERGAFSGAALPFKGLARTAAGGTLFLDEIGDLDRALQVKLLRLLESGEVRSVGSSKTEKIDVRIVAATNRDLYADVRSGKFRWDLLERLSVLTVEVPPLRAHKEDISSIALHWLARLNTTITDAALKELTYYDWPGNIRQLRNVLIRAALCANQEIKVPELEEILSEEVKRVGMLNPKGEIAVCRGPLEDVEKQVILDTLRRCAGIEPLRLRNLELRNRRYTTNCASGEKTRKGARSITVAWTVSLMILSFAPFTFAATSRSLWIFDQFASEGFQIHSPDSLVATRLSFTHYRDIFSYQGSLAVNFSVFDVIGSFGQRSFAGIANDVDGPQKTFLANSTSNISGEIGRLFLAKNRHFGRLGGGVYAFMPGGSQGLKASLATGILAAPAQPWGLLLSVDGFFEPSRQEKKYVVRTMVTRELSETGTSIGGLLGWVYRPVETQGQGSFEYMLFTVGPEFAFRFFGGRVFLGMDWRIWMDSEQNTDPITQATASSNPNEFWGIPELQLRFVIGL